MKAMQKWAMWWFRVIMGNSVSLEIATFNRCMQINNLHIIDDPILHLS